MTTDQLYLELLAAWGEHPLDEGVVKEIIRENFLVKEVGAIRRGKNGKWEMLQSASTDLRGENIKAMERWVDFFEWFKEKYYVEINGHMISLGTLIDKGGDFYPMIVPENE